LTHFKDIISCTRLRFGFIFVPPSEDRKN